MIKSNLGEVTFKGNEIIIGADMVVIIRAYIDNFGFDKFTTNVKIALKSQEEILRIIAGMEMTEELKTLIKEAEEDDLD